MSQLLSKCNQTVNNNQHFGRDGRRETAHHILLRPLGSLWCDMAFHDCKSNICKFPFFHLFLIFQIKHWTILCRYINTCKWFMPWSGFEQIPQSFTSFRKFGFHFTAATPIAFKDQEVAFKTEITNLWIFKYSLAYFPYFSF